jgi:hypothetical protein
MLGIIYRRIILRIRDDFQYLECLWLALYTSRANAVVGIDLIG